MYLNAITKELLSELLSREERTWEVKLDGELVYVVYSLVHLFLLVQKKEPPYIGFEIQYQLIAK